MESKIKVIIKAPQEKPITTTISNDLENMQAIVNGYIEVVTIDKEINLHLVFRKLTPNLAIPRDNIVGTCFFVSSNNEGDFISLNEKQIAKTLDICEKYKISTIFTPDL